MATAYWNGSDTNVLGDDAANWSLNPNTPVAYTLVDGDDLVFDNTTGAWDQPAISYDGSLDGRVFGTITANDGSNCLDGGMSCGSLVLMGGSSAGVVDNGGTCNSVVAGADGSSCAFWSACTGAAALEGFSQSYYSVGDHSRFQGYATNVGATGDDCQFYDVSVDFGSHSGAVTYNDSSIAHGADAGGQITVRDAATLDGVSSNLIDWYSSGYIEDQFSGLGAQVRAYAPLNMDLANTSEVQVTLMSTSASASGFYSANSEVVVVVDSTNIAAPNIKGGVTMLGVTGTLAAPTADSLYHNGGSAGY